MIRPGRFYFLSRIRHFGKSLLVSTLKELFEGNEPLFQGLEIPPHWDRSAGHPVVPPGFRGLDTPGDLENHVLNQPCRIDWACDLKSTPLAKTAPERLENVLYFLPRKAGQQLVVLVDEYDRPVLNVLEDREQAWANRDRLRKLYSILKDAEPLFCLRHRHHDVRENRFFCRS